MSVVYRYSLLQFRSQTIRDERLNVGIAVFGDKNIKLHIAQNLNKLKSISAAIDADQARDAILSLEKIYYLMAEANPIAPDLARERLNSISPVWLSDFGSFTAPSEEVYDRCVDEIMKNLVEPEPAVTRMPKKKNSGLLKEMSEIFRARKILARSMDSIDNHRILRRFDIAEGLKADLLLKNGKTHVVETSIRRVVTDIAVSALVFEQARMRWPQATTSRLVYSACSSLERAATPSLYAAEHQGAQLINWQSESDRNDFISKISSLAQPFDADPDQGLFAINASMLPTRKLN
jgi:Protein of unknown function (DUF3037)